MDERIAKKVEIMKIGCSKEIQSQSEKVGEHLLDVVSKHISYVENFIQQIADHQNIIIKKYSSKIENVE